ncbi:MAG TPA: hypothetical protein VL984_06885 [Acidimicrobiales bacterium]|nr:hypothetical protein [Acidimicrobiales bacterium]
MSPAGTRPPSLAGKLGVKAGQRLLLVGAPAGWGVPGLPEGAVVLRGAREAGRADLVVAFFGERERLLSRALALAEAVWPDGALWVAWPRRAGGHSSDLTDNNVRAALLPVGLVDVKVAVLDNDWSGLKFVWRKAVRAGKGAG